MIIYNLNIFLLQSYFLFHFGDEICVYITLLSIHAKNPIFNIKFLKN